MTVTALKNFIYDARFYKTGETADLPDDKISEYKRRGLIETSTNFKAQPAQVEEVPTLDELPPLEIGRKRK